MNPLEFEIMIAVFGDPRPFVGKDGIASRFWEERILRMARLPAPLPLSWNAGVEVSRFRCHYLLVKAFEAALNLAFSTPEAWATIGDFGGCYQFRGNRKNPKRLSAHAWGTAIDLDVKDNAQGRAPEMHPAIIEAFESQGFIWGGRFKDDAVDGMHFEFHDLTKVSKEVRG